MDAVRDGIREGGITERDMQDGRIRRRKIRCRMVKKIREF